MKRLPKQSDRYIVFKGDMSSKNAQLLDDSDEQNIQQWRIRKLIQSLDHARGNGTSMISLIIPPGEQISRYSRLLAEEYGTASNIKSRVNRLSVLGAITSTQQKLKLYNKVPPNGLVIYCGTILTDENKEKLCLSELLTSDERYGFIVMDGSGSLFGLLSGNTKTILNKITVDLPKKHGRGGQSAVRFARLRLEKRHNYIRKVAELAVQFFITNDRPNISGLILAGLAEFKTDLAQSDIFDQRLQRIIIKIVDVSYGGENGFNQAIDLSQEALQGVKCIAEKKIINKFFEEIAEDTGKYCFGIRDTMHALEAGAVDLLILYEDLGLWRHEMRHSTTGEKKTIYLSSEQEKDGKYTSEDHSEWESDYEKVSAVEWFVQNYKSFGCKLQFVTNKSQEGAQFLKGFGGIGGILRYRLDFDALEYSDHEPSEEEYDLDF